MSGNTVLIMNNIAKKSMVCSRGATADPERRRPHERPQLRREAPDARIITETRPCNELRFIPWRVASAGLKVTTVDPATALTGRAQTAASRRQT